MAEKRKILLITTGGTIAGNVAHKDGESAKSIEAKDFKVIIGKTLKSVKQKWGIEIEVDPYELCNVDSSNILPQQWTELSQRIKDKYDDYDSFLITHGTNTLGYTCAALTFAFENINKPVILTGSQVPYNNPGSDALMNLDNAIRVSVWPHDQIKGVLAVFGSHIIAGPRVKKSTEFDYDAFQSFTAASIGRIGRIININRTNLQKHIGYLSSETNRSIDPDSLPARSKEKLRIANQFDTKSIASFTEFPGMSPDLFRTVVENNEIKGIILRAFGAGDASEHLIESFEYLKEKRIPVIVTTQAPNGNSNFLVNDPGQRLKKEQLAIPSHDMSIESQTAKLAWLLGQGTAYDKINEIMIKDLRGEINPVPELSQ